MRGLFLAIFLIGCGGGGGGGSGTDQGLDRLPPSGIRVIHSDIDESPVRLAIGSQVSGNVRFGDRGAYIPISGDVQAGLFTANTDNLVDSNPITINQRKSILIANGLNVLDDFSGDIPSGFARVRVIHGVKNISELSVKVNDKTFSVGFGAGSDYIEIPAGKFDYLVTSSGSRIAGGSFEAQSGKPYTVLITGESGYLVIKRVFLG
jgi:hypothetical protein